MPTTTSRIVPGPLEIMLMSSPDIYVTRRGAAKAERIILDLRRRRSAKAWSAYDSIPIQVDGITGHLDFVIFRSTVAEMLGLVSPATMSMIRIRFERHSLIEVQEILSNPKRVERSTLLGTDRDLSATECAASIGRTVADIMTLPPILSSVFDGLVVEDAEKRGAGISYGFARTVRDTPDAGK